MLSLQDNIGRVAFLGWPDSRQLRRAQFFGSQRYVRKLDGEV